MTTTASEPSIGDLYRSPWSGKVFKVIEVRRLSCVMKSLEVDEDAKYVGEGCFGFKLPLVGMEPVAEKFSE